MKQAIAIAALFFLVAGAVAADPVFERPKAKEGHPYPECYCTNRGVRVEIGETSCLRVGGREFTARCGVSLNNPAWRDMKEGCAPSPLSRSTPMMKAAAPG
ncbi:MAG: hypothetical protein ACK5MQ_12825 [Pikeienuella sp.]